MNRADDTPPGNTIPVDPHDRVGGGHLDLLLDHAASLCGLGKVREWTVITTGFEDCNIDLTTGTGRVVVKVFAAQRDPSLPERTADLIGRAIERGVHHPRLLRDEHGHTVHHDPRSRNRFLVMDFVEAIDYYTLGRAPTVAELADIIDQAVLIHGIDAHPEFVFDPWAITNLIPLAASVENVLDAEQRRLVAGAIDAVSEIDRGALPHLLIHGDMTKGNVLVDAAGRITVIDFTVANRYPKVQELAMIAANLTHESVQPLPERVEGIADLYSTTTPLTPEEHIALRAFSVAAAAMEFLGAVNEWSVNNNRGAETEYLLGLGLTGLRDCVPAGHPATCGETRQTIRERNHSSAARPFAR